MKEKLVVIDGNSIVNRAFYGLPDLTTTDGRHTNGVLGFLNILIKIAEEEKPDYLAVAFDVKHPTFRHEMYAEYKGTRKGMPEELREQMPLLKQMLSAMGVLTIECPGFEADDILGALSAKGARDGKKVSLVSGDRDLLQLSNDDVLVRIPKTKRTGTEIEDYTPAQVVEKYGVTPAQIVDLKGLMGDASDNIPGVPGIGEKTAVKILTAFPTVEEAIAHVDEVEPKKARESLREHADLARLSKTLATIKTDWEPEFSYETARFGNIFTDEAYKLCKELEFKSLLSRHFSPEQGLTSDDKTFDEKPQVIASAEEAEALFAGLKKDEAVGFSLCGEELVVSVKGKAYVFPVNVTKAEGIAAVLHKVCEKQATPVAIDLKERLSAVEELDRPFFGDAALCAYLLNPLKNSYTYEDIARDYLKLALPAAETLLSAKEPKQLSLFDEPEEDTGADAEARRQVAAYEAMTAQAAYPVLLTELRETGMEELYRTVELPLVSTLYDMEQVGMAVNRSFFSEYSKQLTEGITRLEQEIYRLAGEEFNINSPKQLGVILFEKLKLPGGKKTKTGYSTSADILEKLRSEDPIVENILEYRQLAKLKSTYADGLPAYVGEDGRIHSKFQQMITATGRLSSAEPNLQNIPVRMELGRKIRKAFVPAVGCVFVDADYSQIELRILAHLSGDEQLIRAYREAEDIHRLTASQVFHTPYDEVTPQQRSNAKAVNFGIVYGISSFGLGQDLNISRKEAEEYINRYFETYPKIKQYLDSLVDEAKVKGYVTTLFGRRRPVPEIASSNFMQRSFGERIAMNSPVQGTAADIMKIAMIRVDARLKKDGSAAKIVLQVHDELLIETPENEVEYVKKILQEEMEAAADISVPLEVSVSTGSDWYETK
ncbi:MAG: DNA polymerase I [Lachnospiraceae bacterium]|nr:DNA polymerase I [Lachnospiraceae bacterium]